MASVKAFSARATSSLTTRRDVQAVVVPARGRAGPAPRHLSVGVVCSSSKPGGSLLDAPTTSTIADLEKAFSKSMKKPPTYKVMLHNDNYNRREYVVKVLVKVVDGMTSDDAQQKMQEAHETGVALVIACPQEDAERICEGLRLNGLTSTIEPGC